ncbi:MAG: hypothetical protein K2W96_03215 [Gemmataceae bacterium]|nr:hypothetical protein [Gemmataceae bacterium]
MSESIKRRGSLLSVMLALAAAVACAVFLVLLTGGLFLYVVLLSLAILAFGTFHYFVWGRLLTRLLAREMEEERLLEQAREQADRYPDERYTPR